jgi:UDP-N-acetylmuramoyl-L-alanyl-D-glutamate--2,6-diaminopimelate ligase
MVKLKKLLKDLDVTVKGSKEIDILGITQDSKITKPGDLFIARRGKVFDGTHFIPEAISGGASCLLTDIYNPFYSKTTQIITEDIKETALQIAKRFYENPQDVLTMIGVTGTSGKTTVSYLVKHLLNHIEMPAGIIGTNGYQIKDNILSAPRTTPDSITCLKILKEVVSKELKSCVMEVSSHGLDQGRVDFIDFDVAIFTNFSHEHLDYHGTMDEYLLAKKKLFSLLDNSHKKNPCAIINIDDPAAEILKKATSKKTLSYGIEKQADVQATNLKLSLTGMSFTVSYKEQEQLFSTKLVGKFNVYNLLAAISLGVHLEKSLKELSDIFSKFSCVEGRLQKVLEYKKCHVFVDYAHKVEALKNVLEALRNSAKGKIITLFGCGGNRDHMKRKLMAKVSEEYSDYTIVTTDNCRNEDPNKIISEIVLGFTKKQYSVAPDRREAIKKALEMAGPEDIVLIAGKGHEKVQIYSHKTLPFDDREVVCEFIGE